jgi:lipopolysaccharide export system protein LptA
MPTIKKIVVSGSAISQLSNDAGFALNTAITGAFTAVSGGLQSRLTTVEQSIGGGGGLLSSSAQIASDISGAFTATSGGFSTRITTNETNIGTNTTNIGTLTAATSSYALKTDISGAFTAVSTSLASRTTVLEGTGTIQGVGTTNNVTFANVTATGNVSITGDLFVGGDTVTVNAANLNIEDKFILLNSGSTGTSYEGGIIVESGSTGTGNAFYYDASDNRWSLKGGLVATNTAAVTAEAFMSVAIVNTLANAESSSYYKAGNIIVDGQDIYIVTV